ncbi:YwmB family TATA-box binding protein [Evansella cellulosilytica]|uniref:TATA-box binding protein n=1 Tax=Evansella cellulosilytica (strain ATCC 21833 / DSM 2522 / FERM P-1141 / JCM 9156 / N-4) TaxID=649639 RepID=E6TX88_EVAC2|nr:YwmB family TATA-box binding protein [Evansella cellulosilytica]ADU32283.1 protein of unknown function DUF1779 [Evansella cellulosilytica DSM 2522]
MGNKKQFFVLVSVLLLISMTFLFEENLTRSESNQDPEDTLQYIKETMREVKVDPEQVHIYGRNHQHNFVSYNEVMIYMEQWKATNERVEWTFSETADYQKWVGTFQNPTASYNEKLSIYVMPSSSSKDGYDAYTIYEAAFKAKADWQSTYSELFEPSSTIAKFEKNDLFMNVQGTVTEHEVEIKQWGRSIVEAYSAEVVEQLEEETFVSLSAYTPLLDQQMETNGKEMNLQVALRTIQTGMGEETTVTIGTPLITTEY